MPSPDEPSFQVDYPREVLKTLARWAELAKLVGTEDRYLSELREIEKQLKSTPRIWGDPQRDLHHLSLVLYSHYSPIVTVVYAVHTSRPYVYVKEVRLGDLLAGGPGEGR